MIREYVSEILEGDLKKLKEEINSYTDESKLWIIGKGINNSAGNLCLHLLGNLNHYIGTILGNSGYIRNRDAEFSSKNVPKNELLKNIDAAIETVSKTIASLKEEDLKKIYPEKILNKKLSTGFYLIHITTHFNYHLGQINYHRRLLE